MYLPEKTLLSNSDIHAGAGAPQVMRDYIWFGGLPIAEEVSSAPARYTFGDHLGTPFMQTSTTGTIVWRAEYEPFGAVWTMGVGAASDQRLRFPGQEFDEQTPDRTYNIFRWYNTALGRYTQADALVKDGDPNAYLYGAANPITTFDRHGTIAEVVCAGITLFGLPWTPFRHCRIRVTCEKCESGKFGGPYDTSVGLERDRKSPTKNLDVTEAPVGAEYTYHYPINNVDQKDSCQFGRCVRGLAAAYDDDAPRWTPQYSIFGPNSNGFAGYVNRIQSTIGVRIVAPLRVLSLLFAAFVAVACMRTNDVTIYAPPELAEGAVLIDGVIVGRLSKPLHNYRWRGWKRLKEEFSGPPRHECTATVVSVAPGIRELKLIKEEYSPLVVRVRLTEGTAWTIDVTTADVRRSSPARVRN